MRQLFTGKGPLTFEHLAFDDAARIERFASEYSLPYLADFLSFVRHLQEGQGEIYGRRYQREVLRSGSLTLVSPFTGNFVTSCDSVPTVRGGVGYHFSDGSEFYVLSSQVRIGFPLAGLYVPSQSCLLIWGGRGAIKKRHVPRIIDALARDRTAESRAATERPTIIIGHRNFAHHMWNELSALDSLLRDGNLSPPPRLTVHRQTLGPLTEIFPEIGGWTIERTDDDDWTEASGRMFVNIAGTRLTREFRNRLVRHAHAAASGETVSLIGRIRDAAAPVFWLSLRSQAPTLTNQKEVLVAVSRRLLQRFDSCCIVFDGFSLPEDWETAGRLTPFYVTAAAEAKRDIDIVLAELKEVFRLTGQTLVNAGGLRVLDSIALAQAASAYFCHVGTVQHKIGWTTLVPGIIHGNRRILATDPAERHSEWVDGAIVPAQVDLEMVQDERRGDKESNYRAIDVERLADSVVARLVGYVLQ